MFKRKNLSEPIGSSSRGQWRIYDIYSAKSKKLNIGQRSSEQSSPRFGNLLKAGLTVLISVLIIFTIVKAGSLTPSNAPAPEGYTLADIYTRLTTNATATSGNFSMDPSDPVGSTLYTLEQIYNAIPTIVANTVKLDTAYLGIDGTLIPSGGDSETTDVCQNKTFFGSNQTDWNLQTGSLSITPSTVMSGTTICGVAGTAIANPTYGDDDASKVLTIAANAGTYNATNLIPANVRNTIAFGVDQIGTFTGNLAYGDDDPSKVLTTAATPGTWRAYNLNDSVVKFGIEYATSSTGALLPSGGTATTSSVVSGLTFFGDNQTDWNLQTGTFASQEKTATSQNQEVTPDSGNWLSKVIVNITNLIASVIKKGETVGGVEGELLPSGGTATTSDVCSSKTFFGDSQTNWTLQAGSLSIVASTIGVGNTYCGVEGILLKNLYNGTDRSDQLSAVTLNTGGSGYTSGDNWSERSVPL